MLSRYSRRFLFALGLLGASARVVLSADESPSLADYYGFAPLEIVKLDSRSHSVIAGDLNGDGLTDLVAVDNSHSRLDLLIQRKERPKAKASSKPEVNELADAWRFEHRKLPVDKQVAALALGDLNGDGRTDLAYFGVPDRLVVRLQSKDGEFSDRTSIRLADVQANQWIVAVGDLNGDKRDDIAVLGKESIYVLLQGKDGRLGSPTSIMNTSQKLGLLQIADVDGDGRKDLCYVASDDDRSLCVRLQSDGGRLSPELRFELSRPRGVTVSNVDGKPGSEIITIDSRTGRVKVLAVKRPEAKPGEVAGRLIQYGFGGATRSSTPDVAIGDVDGDGLSDVVVADPEQARMILFRQHKSHGLDLGNVFPGLVGADQIRIGNTDGKTPAVFVLSPREKTLGESRLQDGRLTFPQSLPTVGEPGALELADLNGDGKAEVVYISRDRSAGGSKYELRALKRSGKKWTAFRFGDKDAVAVNLPGTPKRLVRLDANGDGRSDFLVFAGLDRAPILVVTGKDGVPAIVETKGGINIGDVSPGAVFFGQLDRPALLVAQKNFARHMQLDGDRWSVVDQYNAAESKASIAGAVTLNLDGKPGNEIALIDTGVKRLRILRRENNLFRPWREVELGDFPYDAAHTADFNGDGNQDLLLFGGGKFAVLYAGRTDPTLKTVSSFETKLERTFFADVAAGDLNGDGVVDLAVFDTRQHYVEILDVDPKQGLRHAMQFKLYEEKSFGRGTAGGTNPREAAIADVTGDGRKDLIVLMHDRVIVYPQDAPRGPGDRGK